jgi:hypothetical protein
MKLPPHSSFSFGTLQGPSARTYVCDHATHHPPRHITPPPALSSKHTVRPHLTTTSSSRPPPTNPLDHPPVSRQQGPGVGVKPASTSRPVSLIEVKLHHQKLTAWWPGWRCMRVMGRRAWACR